MLGLAVAAYLGSGCVGVPATGTGNNHAPDTVAQAGKDAATSESRGQKPDVTPTSWNSTPDSSKPADQAPERSSELANAPTAAKVGVMVNGEAILMEEIRHACIREWRFAEQITDPEQRHKKQVEALSTACEHLIDREVVLQDAYNKLNSNKNTTKFLERLKEAAKKEFEKKYLGPVREEYHLKTDEEVRTALKAQGVSLDLMRRQIERDFMMFDYLRNLVYSNLDRIGHAQVVEYYDTHPEEFQLGDSIEWQDIFIAKLNHPSSDAARRFAEAVIDRARAGEDFIQLAKRFDNGECVVRKSVGEGQYRGEIKPAEAEELLFRLKEGEIGPPVEIATGFHIVRVVKRTYKGMKPFDEKVQKQIKDKLRNETAQKEIKRIIYDLRHNAIIERSPAGMELK
jgi:peptidyl-prolyl cis-trans isomerase SurA